MTSWLDRLVTGGLLFLVVTTPLAFGAVHPWAYAMAETVVFGLALAWASKVLLFGLPHEGHLTPPRAMALPLVLFVALSVLQLAPVAPGLLRTLSPVAYELYAKSLPGWPAARPYADLASAGPDPGRGSVLRALPTAAEVRAAPAPGARIVTTVLPAADTQRNERSAARGVLEALDEDAPVTRTLSVAPSASWRALFKLVAYVTLLLLVALYPANRSPEGDWSFVRPLLRAVVVAGVLVAVLGLLQRFAWNGRILWFFVPEDWPAGPDPRPQTNGPFVSRSSFAGYLTLVLPLALACALCPTRLDLRNRRGTSRVLFAAASALLGFAILMSLSRGAWIAAFVAVSVLLLSLGALPAADRPWLLRSRARVLGAAGLLVLALVTILAVPLDPVRGNDVDARLEATLSDPSSAATRLAYWHATLAMIRDFPLFGSGLGTWTEIFPRYDVTPYAAVAPREAHNDYLQLAAETGLAGALLLGLAAAALALRLVRSLPSRPPPSRPVMAALLAALAGLAVHEVVDFDLQIPAIALLAALLAGVALRATLAHGWMPRPARRLAWFGAGALAAALLVVGALRQGDTAGSVGGAPSTVAEALRAIDAAPARSGNHLALYYLLERELPDAPRTRELRIASWLAPRSPYPRDALAADLASRGRERRALATVEESVFRTPDPRYHFYLRPRIVPFLSPAETAAIERGLERAWRDGEPRAPTALARLYAERDRPAEAADVLERAAEERRDDSRVRYSFLLEAGIARLEAGQPAAAEKPLREACEMRPAETAPYVRLIEALAARRDGLDQARDVARRGALRGADAYRLQLALADAARARGDDALRVAALQEAVRLRPSAAEAHLYLGLAYLDARRYESASHALRRAAEIDPAAPDVWYYVGRAEEARYNLVAAERALERAAELAPDHRKTRESLAQVRELLAQVQAP